MKRGESENPFELMLDEINRGPKSTVKDSEENPFNELNKSQTEAPKFNFGSMLKSNNKRQDVRHSVTGSLVIYDKDMRPLARAVLRNVSLSGVGIETMPIPLTAKSRVVIEMGRAGAEFGRLSCVVCWVAHVDGNPQGNLMVGLKFDNETSEFKRKFERYIKQLVKISK